MQDSVIYIYMLIFGLIIIVLAMRLLSHARYPYVKQKIMSPAELRFYKCLKYALPHPYALTVKPRLGDIVDIHQDTKHKDKNWKGQFGATIWAKHVDFAVFNPDTGEVLAAIELDDASHNTKDARQRDRFKDRVCAAATLPLLRIPVQRTYNTADIKRDLRVHINSQN